jgi:hypothetical protein
MKKTAFAITALVAVTDYAAVAHAGAKEGPFAPIIDTQQRFAVGAISETRNTPDTTSRIECQVGISASGFGMACYAVDANNRIGTCISSSPTFAQLAAAVQSDSYIEFHWDEAGNCTSLTISEDSMTAPKQP